MKLVALALLVTSAVAPSDERLKELERDLVGGDGKKKRAAVIELAKLDTLEAWKLVVGALDDNLSQVADEAQLQIAAIDDDKAREALLGKDGLKSKAPLVRARVVESFARMNARPSATVLIDAIGDKDASVRRTAAWTVERLQDAGKFAGLWDDLIGATQLCGSLIQAAEREKDADTCAALTIAANVVLEKPDVAVPASLAADKRASLRAAGMLLARRLPDAAGLPVARKLANDADIGVRANVADALASWANKPSMVELAGLLEGETQLRARWRIVDHLRALSGMKHGLDAASWKAWAQSLADDWKPGEPVAKEKDDASSTVALVGLPILSERVCFVIDLSGSVWQKRADGKTKKEVLDAELAKALRALTPSTQFNLIPYTSKPIPWQRELVPATEKNVAAALEFFTKRKDTGTGNFWDAYLLALEDPAVDTIVNLSDGAPTGGDRWNLGLMRELMREKNRFRRVALDAVLTDASKTLVEHWAGMCADSGGRWVEVELD